MDTVTDGTAPPIGAALFSVGAFSMREPDGVIVGAVVIPRAGGRSPDSAVHGAQPRHAVSLAPGGDMMGMGRPR